MRVLENLSHEANLLARLRGIRLIDAQRIDPQAHSSIFGGFPDLFQSIMKILSNLNTAAVDYDMRVVVFVFVSPFVR